MEQYRKAVELWQSYGIQSPDELDRHLDSFRVLFAYHSGKIENDGITYGDTREVFEDGRVRSFQGDPRTLFEIQNQKTCYSFLLPKIAEGEPLTVDLVKEIHALLTAGTYDERRYLENGERPGEFKKHDYVTGLYEVGAAPEEVEGEITGLLEEINKICPDTPEKLLKAAAYFHARFEYIHPFADGNGRVGRTLVNYYLMINNHPPLIVFEEDRKEYYAALQLYDENEEVNPLFRFFAFQIEKTWEKTMERQSGKKPIPWKRLEDLL